MEPAVDVASEVQPIDEARSARSSAVEHHGCRGLQGGPVAFVVEGRVPGRAEKLVRRGNYETARTPRTLARAKIAAASMNKGQNRPNRATRCRGAKVCAPREVAAIRHPAPMIELLGLLLATPRQRPPTVDPGAEPPQGSPERSTAGPSSAALHHVYERAA